jgi:hypothetical protein
MSEDNSLAPAKRSKGVFVKSPDGEIHLILQDIESCSNLSAVEDFDKPKIKRIMIREALKPLFLMREE